MTPRITDDGMGVMVIALDGAGVEFTKLLLGNGDKPENYRSLKGLVNPVTGAEIGLDSIERNDDYVTLTGVLNRSTLASSFTWTEIGVFCKDPAGGNDLMYAYGHCQIVSDGEEESSGTVISKTNTDLVELKLKVHVFVGEIEGVSATLAGTSEYATSEELNAHLEDAENPHKVTKEQIGLGTVPNVATNDQAPTYTASSALSNLVSGEKLSVAFGKIAKAITDLISHIGNKNNPHGVTLSQIGAAASSHNHSAANITSGTLGIARGGTGATTAEAAVHALSGVYAGTVGSTYRITSGKNLNDYRTAGTYWCTSGDIASSLKNCPYTNSNFVLVVFAPNDSNTFQAILPCRGGTAETTLYVRSRNSGTWGSWRKITTTSV